MRPSRCIVMLLSLALAAPLASQESSTDPAREAVSAVVEAVGAGMEAGDWTSLDTLFSASRGVHIIEGAGVDHGWAAYRDGHLKPELESFEDFSYRYYSIEPQVRGDAAWASFRYELSAGTQRGQVEVEGRGTGVLERMDGRWQVVHLHTSGRRKS